MTREIKKLQTLSKEPSRHAVELGDFKSYVFRGLRSSYLKLENGGKIHIISILYVPGLKKDFLSISLLEDKGDRVFLLMERFCSGKNIVVLIKLESLEIWYIKYGHLQ